MGENNKPFAEYQESMEPAVVKRVEAIKDVRDIEVIEPEIL